MHFSLNAQCTWSCQIIRNVFFAQILTSNIPLYLFISKMISCTTYSKWGEKMKGCFNCERYFFIINESLLMRKKFLQLIFRWLYVYLIYTLWRYCSFNSIRWTNDCNRSRRGGTESWCPGQTGLILWSGHGTGPIHRGISDQVLQVSIYMYIYI